ncbi:hypothetical protein [Desulfosporosinus burensis]
MAGSQRGLAEERSGLFFEIVRLIEGKAAEDRPHEKKSAASQGSAHHNHNDWKNQAISTSLSSIS